MPHKSFFSRKYSSPMGYTVERIGFINGATTLDEDIGGIYVIDATEAFTITLPDVDSVASGQWAEFIRKDAEVVVTTITGPGLASDIEMPANTRAKVIAVSGTGNTGYWLFVPVTATPS